MQKQEPIGLLIAIVRRRIKQVVSGLAQPFGLSPQQFWMVVGLAERDGMALCEVAKNLRMDDPTASRIITALVARRLVQIAADPVDRRRTRLHLTSSGRSLAQELRPLAARIRAAITRGIEPAEQEIARATLRKIVANLDRFERKGIVRASEHAEAARETT